MKTIQSQHHFHRRSEKMRPRNGHCLNKGLHGNQCSLEVLVTLEIGEGPGSSLDSEPDQQVWGQRWEDGRTKKRVDNVWCVSKREEDSVEHVLLRFTAYRSEREQLWKLMESEWGISEGWGWLDEEEKVKVLLGQNMSLEGGERIDSSIWRAT